MPRHHIKTSIDKISQGLCFNDFNGLPIHASWGSKSIGFASQVLEAARLTIALELKQRLPRLIFAAVDAFPLADGGKETGLH